MSVVVGIDPSVQPERRVAVSRNVGGWRVVPKDSRAHQVVLSVPSEMLTFRTLTLPFSDRRRAEAVARQELSNSLALPLTDVRWSLCQLSRHDYLAVVSPRVRLDALAGTWRPDVADGEPFAYARVLAAAGIKEGLVVDLGVNRTVFCHIVNQRPSYVRVLLRGANPQAGRDAVDRLLADAVLPPLAAGSGIYVTGSLAGHPPLTTALEERLQRPVKPCPVPEGLNSENDVSALGAALRGVYPEDGVDLLQQRRASQPQWAPWAVSLAVVLLLWSADLALRLLVAQRHTELYQTAMKNLMKPYLVQSLDTLKAQVDKIPVVKTSSTQLNLLDVMRTISDTAKGHNIHLQEVHFGSGHVHVLGDAQSDVDEDAFQKALTAIFKDLQVEDTHPTRDKKIQFRFRLGGGA